MATPKDEAQAPQFSEESAQQRDALLLKLLKTPPQPRPKRERKPKRKSKKQTPDK